MMKCILSQYEEDEGSICVYAKENDTSREMKFDLCTVSSLLLNLMQMGIRM